MTLPLLLALAAAAAPAPHARGCDDSNTAGMVECASRDAAAADAALNATWRRVLAAIRKDDADPDAASYRGRGDPTTGQALLDAQRAWLAFREKQCRAETLNFVGGTMRPAVDASCRATVTRARTRQLQAMVEDR